MKYSQRADDGERRQSHDRRVEKYRYLFTAESPGREKGLNGCEDYRQFAAEKQQGKENESVRDGDVRFEFRDLDRDPRAHADREAKQQQKIEIDPGERNIDDRPANADKACGEHDDHVTSREFLEVHSGWEALKAKRGTSILF